MKSELRTARKLKKHRTALRYSGVAYALIVPFIALLVALLITGCSKRYQDLPAFSAIPFRDAENQSVGRFKTSYLADQIHAYFRGNASGPIAVTTFVDIDNLYQSSTFGRILAEQLMSELSMRGYNVIELRQAEAMQIMFDQGEFGLSRDTHTLKKNQEISAMIVGTYAVSPVRVYLNARVIDPASSLITSVGSVEMGKTTEIARLLRTNAFPQTLERIPVKHMGYTVGPAAPTYFPYGSPYWLPSYSGWGYYPPADREEAAPALAPPPRSALPEAHQSEHGSHAPRLPVIEPTS